MLFSRSASWHNSDVDVTQCRSDSVVVELAEAASALRAITDEITPTLDRLKEKLHD